MTMTGNHILAAIIPTLLMIWFVADKAIDAWADSKKPPPLDDSVLDAATAGDADDDADGSE